MMKGAKITKTPRNDLLFTIVWVGNTIWSRVLAVEDMYVAHSRENQSVCLAEYVRFSNVFIPQISKEAERALKLILILMKNH